MSAHLYQAVLHAMLQKSVWSGVRHVAAECFVETTMRLLVAQTDSLHARIADRDLELDDLRLAVEAAYSGQLAGDLVAYIAAMGEVAPAANTVVREVLARELLDQAQQAILDARNRGQLDIAKPAEYIQRAQDVTAEAGSEAAMTLESAYTPAGEERGPVVPLGLSVRLDQALGGGIGVGEFTVVHGPSKRGKTAAMVKASQSMVAAGRCVLYISGEMGSEQLMRLHERAMLRKTRREWTDADTAEARTRLAAKGGRLYIKDLSATTITPDIVEGTIRAIQRTDGVQFDVVFIDHLEHLTPSRIGGAYADASATRLVHNTLSRQIRRMGRRLGTRIVTGWQSNRDGTQADTLTEMNIAEGDYVFKNSDNWITLNRSAHEKRNHVMRLGLLKQRVDDDNLDIVQVFCDWSRMIMEDPINAVYPAHAKTESAAGEGQRGSPGISGRPCVPADEHVPTVSVNEGG